MQPHPFRIAIERRAGGRELARLFAPDAVLFAPMLSRPVTGVERLTHVLEVITKVVGPTQYTYEANDGRQTMLLWHGTVGGFKLEAATIVVDGEDGLVREVRTLMRSWPMVTLFRNAVRSELASMIPAEAWELAPKPSTADAPRRFTPIALKPIEMADNVALHSPILAKSVEGKRNVETALRMAHAVQSPSSYTSIIATAQLLIELFDCDADGYPMEGIWASRLSDRGQIDDLTVYLRPYPAVTVLRNRAKALAATTDAFSFLNDTSYWELPSSR